jgi:uncharacterized iron-regulated membrane protein
MSARWYNSVWRWHFYAGIFCLPFVIWLSCTGGLYLWRPQIEAWLDRPYDRLAVATAAPVDAQVAAAVAAVPGSALKKFQLPDAPGEAVRIIVSKGGRDTRVYVDPCSLAVLKVINEEDRLFRIIFRLHGELLAGTIGSYIVEIAACWTIVMLLSGLYLWWPRARSGLSGVIYPRLSLGGRTFWRDIHAVAGFWVTIFAMVLILTGLPWAKGWGTYLTEIRQFTGTARGTVDWTIGGRAPKEDAMSGDHTGHVMSHDMNHGMVMNAPSIVTGDLARVIATVEPLGIAGPVMISPPKSNGAPWSVTSDAANRPTRSDLKIDGATGRLLDRKDFSQRHWIDRVIGYGIAVHEGALFGLLNQIIGTLTVLMLVILSVSGVIMWWKRRPAGSLGAPVSRGRPALGLGLVSLIVALAIYMPMFGVTLLAVLLLEIAVLRHVGPVRRWLGLGEARQTARA